MLAREEWRQVGERRVRVLGSCRSSVLTFRRPEMADGTLLSPLASGILDALMA